MNANQLMNMAIRRLMRKGINTGIDIAENRGKRPADMTEAERQTAGNARQTGRKAQQGIKLLRRFMR
ncbi:hypothetical protein [Yoonia sediminilitoris]|uniref:Uncharacterized protein n=1 Tax=Yoonia sediminilitoris TaxID=1286148 RepID=A0A2T6KRM4_9RHOB|nr:hypothetical protein [Yoonia sediminilitoris]PUB19216.1 hypothetical protein C8N45_101809 [Yoonia sediminilitoris]RCW99384.1 hypothetical protein DFP92_101809 [Yoonia sediminilitoris]